MVGSGDCDFFLFLGLDAEDVLAVEVVREGGHIRLWVVVLHPDIL